MKIIGFLALDAPPKCSLKNVTRGLICRQNLMYKIEKVRSSAMHSIAGIEIDHT